MHSALCSAAFRCDVRRLRRVVVAAPLPATVVAILVLLAPVALVRVGHTVGRELAGAVRTQGVAEGLVLGPALAAAVAGAALAVTLPGRSALGQQLAAGPCGALEPVWAGLVFPLAIGAMAVTPSLTAVSVGVAGSLPGGPVAGLALAAATLAALPVGALLAEGGLVALRGRRRRLLSFAAPALGWAAIGGALGSPLLGPVAAVAPALRDVGSAWLALALAVVTGMASFLTWLVLAAARPENQRDRARRGTRLVRGGSSSVPAALAGLLGRRDDIRLATAGALGFGIAGIAVAAMASAPAPAPFLLATTTTLLGSVLGSLAVCGAVLCGRWLWLAGPADRRLIALAAGVVGLVATSLPVVAVGVIAAVVTGATPSAVGVTAAFVVVGSAAALCAGALVPWREAGIGDQMTTFAALAVIAIAASLVVGLVVPRLVARGVPDIAAAILICVISLGVAFSALERRLVKGA